MSDNDTRLPEAADEPEHPDEAAILAAEHPGNCSAERLPGENPGERSSCGHRSDCALHNRPAMAVKSCTCKGMTAADLSTKHIGLIVTLVDRLAQPIAHDTSFVLGKYGEVWAPSASMDSPILGWMLHGGRALPYGEYEWNIQVAPDEQIAVDTKPTEREQHAPASPWVKDF